MTQTKPAMYVRSLHHVWKTALRPAEVWGRSRHSRILYGFMPGICIMQMCMWLSAEQVRHLICSIFFVSGWALSVHFLFWPTIEAAHDWSFAIGGGPSGQVGFASADVGFATMEAAHDWSFAIGGGMGPSDRVGSASANDGFGCADAGT